MDDIRSRLYAYLLQQKDLGAPDYILNAPFRSIALSETPRVASRPADKLSTMHASVLPARPALLPAGRLHGATAGREAGSDPVRDALVKLHDENKNCVACGLGRTRKNFVFGSGNARAGLMVVGEAPGAEEDERGLPFVGRAGELLTKMLAAIGCDRKKDAFIANVVKCRPPENRNPDQTEILACKHILLSQIDIIKPRIILLLGRVAAHTLLDTAESIAALRTQSHTVAGIPAFVTYHPAALLRNEENKRPAWEDMQKVQRALLLKNEPEKTGDHAD